MLRSLRYLILLGFLAWIALNLFSQERRRRLDAGVRRATIVISLAFIGTGLVWLYQALFHGGADLGQAVVLVVVGLALMVYHGWSRH